MANLQYQPTPMRTSSLAALSVLCILTGCRTEEQSYSTYASLNLTVSGTVFTFSQ